MKATINGINIEGTPEEIWEVLRIKNAEGTNLKPVQPNPFDTGYNPWQYKPSVTSDGTTSRCTGSCYCTGACNTSTMTKLSESFNALNKYEKKWDGSTAGNFYRA